MKRAVLVQLPVPGYLWPLLDANIPLASGYLAAWAAGPGSILDWEFELLPWQEADILGDEALLRAILGREPDLVGFSLYLWNSERSLGLARRLHDAGVRVALGGPELLPDNRWLWEAAGFAARLPGEGEEAFAHLLAGTAEAAGCPLDLAKLPSPYLSGVLPPYPDGSVWLETVRGCPFRCAYCHYGKGSGSVRRMAPGWLEAHLAWAGREGGRELYLMDPSFNVRPDWEETLRGLEEGNREGALRFHTELVADRLRRGDGRRLAAAGLRSCEVGLQTIHASVLAQMGRSWVSKAWLEGVRELTGAGVKVTVGLIAGLPGDDLAGFAESLEFVLREAPDAELQLFPLAVLPGTRLKERSSALDLVALERPPYTVVRTRGFSAEELSSCVDLFEEATGLELDPFGPPALAGFEGAPRLADATGYVSGLLLDVSRAPEDWVERIAPRAAQNFILWVRGWHEDLLVRIREFTARLPETVLTVVLDDEPGWPPERGCTLLSYAGRGEHYLDRYFTLLYGRGARLVPRLVAILRENAPVDAEWKESLGRVADLVRVVSAKGGWVREACDAVESGEFALVRGTPEPTEFAALRDAVGDDAPRVLFARIEAQARWESSAAEPTFRAEQRWARLP